MKTKKFTTKFTAVLMAVLMIALTVPFAFAANPIALTQANVYKWPTVKQLVDEIWYGQYYPELFEIVEQGIVTTDGTAEGEVIPGKFELLDEITLWSGNDYVRFSFIPDDTETYSGITRTYCPDLKIFVNETTLEFVDEENDPIIASPVEPGSRLGTSTLSGGHVYNPHNPDEPSALNAKWIWLNSNEVVNESGYHQAALAVGFYTIMFKDVWVDVLGGSKEIEIKDLPSEINLTYDGNLTWGDVIEQIQTMTKPVEKDTDNEVSGTFSIIQPRGGVELSKDTKLVSTTYENYIIKFTPNDSETYAFYTQTISINVAKGIPTWKDGITPVVTVPYGTRIEDNTFHNLRYDGSVVTDESVLFRLCDAEGNFLHDGVFLDCGTYYDYQLKATFGSTYTNWQDTLLPVTIVVEPGEAEITVSYNSFTNKLIVSGTSVYLYGTFDIYIDGELAFDDAPLERYIDTQRFETDWMPADISENSTHDIKVIYNKADNDNVFIASDFEGSFTFEARRNITTGEKSIHFYKNSSGFTPGITALFAGDEITANAGLSSFRYWKITDSKGNDVDLEFVKGDMNSSEIIFVMPEFDINVDYVTQADIDRQEAIDNCDCLCHNDNPIVQFFWRIILFFMNLFKVENVCDCGYPHGS